MKHAQKKHIIHGTKGFIHLQNWINFVYEQMQQCLMKNGHFDKRLKTLQSTLFAHSIFRRFNFEDFQKLVKL